MVVLQCWAATWGGVTGLLLSADGGQFAHSVRLDVLVPVQGFKRCVDYQYGYGAWGVQRWPGETPVSRTLLTCV